MAARGDRPDARAQDRPPVAAAGRTGRPRRPAAPDTPRRAGHRRPGRPPRRSFLRSALGAG